MNNIFKAMIIASTFAVGVAQAANLSESDYPFAPGATSPVVEKTVEQRIIKESASPKIVVKSTKTRDEVMHELAEYNEVNGDEFISH